MNKSALAAAFLLGAANLALGPAGCTSGAETSGPNASGTALGIEKDFLDKTVKPGDDFYAYANGGWVKSAVIPDDKSSIGGFSIARDKTEDQLGALLKDIVGSGASDDSDAGRIKALYTSFLDTRSIEAQGLAPLQADLDRFNAISDVKSLSRVLGEQMRADVDPLNATNFQTENLFGLFVTQSLKGGEVMPYLLQGGLGMPERDYYLSSDAKMADLRTKYRGYLAGLFQRAELSDPEARADRVMALEMKIAQAHVSREQSEDFQNSATEWSKAEFAAKAPGIDWTAYMDAASLGSQQRFAAYHAPAITRLSALVASEPIDAWKDWLIAHQISTHAAVLPERFDSWAFQFHGTALQGTKAQRTREKRALGVVNTYLGDALGKLYVEKHFPPQAKAEIQGMVGEIKTAFARRIEGLDWMSPSTRKEAIEKVRTIEVGVGYPDKWKDYAGFAPRADTAYANIVAAEKLATAQQIAKIGKPMDRREWWMNAQLVNAVNLPVQNALNFPAAILQRPFFDPKADAAYNYGAIGAVIGHEISHSFDNNGAAFDATGKLRNWWTPSDLARFQKAGKALADQYDAYKPFDDLHLNGKLTLGENIADVAGLATALEAYHASLKGKQAAVIDGFTGDQRFFIAYAQSWATKMRDESLRGRIATDGHAPGMYRALTVRNVDAWYRAFDVQPGEKLYLPPEKRVKVW
ncbi:MAG: M13 family metallopeptidase [Novosphingobium sp.]